MSSVFLHFPDSRKNFTVEAGKVFVAGRNPACDLNLPFYFDKGHLGMISGRHFKIYKEAFGSDFYIIDISTNGTEINGVRLRRDEPQKLKDGDTIRLAQSNDFQIRITTSTASTAQNLPSLGISFHDGLFYINDIEIPDGHFAAREKELLYYLYQKGGEVCSHHELIDNLHYGGKQALAAAVSRLRQKLNQALPNADGYVETVTQQGYRLRKAN